MKMTTPSERRLRKELMGIIQNPTQGIIVDADKISENINNWIVLIETPKESVYEGEIFTLQFIFNEKYPFESPIVQFCGKSIPENSHVYTNGHICLSILSEDWSPALSVQSVCLSILSMLSSAKKKERPSDDLVYTRTCNKNPKKTRWFFHDDSV